MKRVLISIVAAVLAEATVLVYRAYRRSFDRKKPIDDLRVLAVFLMVLAARAEMWRDR